MFVNEGGFMTSIEIKYCNKAFDLTCEMIKKNEFRSIFKCPSCGEEASVSRECDNGGRFISTCECGMGVKGCVYI